MGIFLPLLSKAEEQVFTADQNELPLHELLINKQDADENFAWPISNYSAVLLPQQGNTMFQESALDRS